MPIVHRAPVIRALLDAGVSPNIQDVYGSALNMVVSTYSFPTFSIPMGSADADHAAALASCVDLLLNADVNVLAKERHSGSTVLHLVFGHHEKIVAAIISKLIDANADVNARGRSAHSETALHKAVRSQFNPSIIEKLIASGADTAALDSYGKTAAQRDTSRKYPCLHN